ncbi:MAG: metal ABC transporter ATP-binding protein [bacterium]|nr:metal ABC transporter ATP-binding protein [bacterium]
MRSAEPIIQAERLTIRYDARREPALADLTVCLEAGDRIALIGPNGAGKSTFIKAVMGLVRPTSGSIHVAVDPLRIGYVAQQDDIRWDFPVTVRDVVLMGCTRRIGWLRVPGRAHWHMVDSALEQVGMRDLAGVQIGELSGGQRRRAFIARALAQDARLLILDEPFSGVDASAQADLMHVLDDLNAGGLTTLLSTHDLDLAFRHFDKVMAVRRRLIAYGPPHEVYTSDALAQLYGSRIVAVHGDGHPMTLFVDDHHCTDC